MSTKKKVEEELKTGKDSLKPVVKVTPMKKAVVKEQKRTRAKKPATPAKASPKPSPKKRATRGKASAQVKAAENVENEAERVSPVKGRSTRRKAAAKASPAKSKKAASPAKPAAQKRERTAAEEETNTTKRQKTEDMVQMEETPLPTTPAKGRATRAKRGATSSKSKAIKASSPVKPKSSPKKRATRGRKVVENQDISEEVTKSNTPKVTRRKGGRTAAKTKSPVKTAAEEKVATPATMKKGNATTQKTLQVVSEKEASVAAKSPAKRTKRGQAKTTPKKAATPLASRKRTRGGAVEVEIAPKQQKTDSEPVAASPVKPARQRRGKATVATKPSPKKPAKSKAVKELPSKEEVVLTEVPQLVTPVKKATRGRKAAAPQQVKSKAVSPVKEASPAKTRGTRAKSSKTSAIKKATPKKATRGKSATVQKAPATPKVSPKKTRGKATAKASTPVKRVTRLRKK